MKNIKRALFTIAAVAAALGCGASETTPTDSDRVALENLDGTYADPTPYPYGAAFGHRTFTFEDGRWTLDFILGLDPKLEAKVFRFRTHGDYRVVEPSQTVPGAYDATFVEEAKYLTLLADDPGLAAAFGLDQCGLTVGEEKDISADGCAAWKPVAECNQDHDLLAVTRDGGVQFGVRPPDNDMCTADKRPESLTSAVVPQ